MKIIKNFYNNNRKVFAHYYKIKYQIKTKFKM